MYRFFPVNVLEIFFILSYLGISNVFTVLNAPFYVINKISPISYATMNYKEHHVKN